MNVCEFMGRCARLVYGCSGSISRNGTMHAAYPIFTLDTRRFRFDSISLSSGILNA